MTIENTPAVDSALIQNIAILGFMLSGIGTFGWQLYNYLRSVVSQRSSEEIELI
jgi:hypothetical protein